MDYLISLVVTGLVIGVVYSLVALGFVLIYKASGVFNFAQGELMLLGGYVCYTLLRVVGLPLWATVVVGLALAAIFGLIVERLALRRLMGQSMLAVVMVTLALSQIIKGGVLVLWGAFPKEFVQVLPPGSVVFGNITVSNEHWLVGLIAIGLLLALTLFFRYTWTGLAMRGMADGHLIVQSMGISPRTIIGIAWAISAMVATAGGTLLGSLSGFTMNLSSIGLRAIPAAFVGGLDSIPGAIIGGLLIGVVETLVSGYVGRGAGTPVVYLVLIVVMFFRPYGFFGLERIERA